MLLVVNVVAIILNEELLKCSRSTSSSDCNGGDNISGDGGTMVAHGRVVTSSRQITEVKQRRARLVLGWVIGARVMLPAMCRGVGLSYHAASVHPAVMGTWWNEQWRIVNGNSCRKCAEFSPEEMRPYKREFQYQGCKL